MPQFRFLLPMKDNKMELVKLVKDVPKIYQLILAYDNGIVKLKKLWNVG